MISTGQWLLRFVGFVAVLVVADLAAGLFRISYWTPFENPQALRIFEYQHEMSRADILFVGTSRIRTAVIPTMIEAALSSVLGRDISVYCLGQDGSSAYTNWLVLDDVVAVHGLPELIVLEVSPGSLNANHRHVAKDLRFHSSIGEILGAVCWINTSDRLTAAAGGCFRGPSSLLLYGSRWLYPRQFEKELTRYRRRKGAQFPDKIPRRFRRLTDLDASQRRAQLAGGIAHARQQYMEHYTVGGAPGAGLRATIVFAGNHGIPVVLLDPPMIHEYREAVSTPEEIAQYREAIDRVLRDPRASVVEADLSNLELAEADFLDLTHLNPSGAHKASRFLAESVLVPLMAKQEMNSRQ